MISWNSLNEQQKLNALSRPALKSDLSVERSVLAIISEIKTSGDKALLDYAIKFDNRVSPRLRVPKDEIINSENALSDELKEAIDLAYANIKTFHQAQLPSNKKITTAPGVECELKYQAIQAVGLYVPGGSAPLPSSVLMQGVCAQLSGCKNIVLATPVNDNKQIHPAILYAAKLCGINCIVESGGAGVIAAMAFGTESVPKVNKIFGPGNSYVTKAKQILSQQVPGFAIDMPAGPSEVMVIADQRANPEFIAADLLSQAEHGIDSQVILLCNSAEIVLKTQEALNRQVNDLTRSDIAKKALKNSALVITDSIEQCFDISKVYGPEHLILQINNAEKHLDSVENAGSVFVGDYTPESAGDYASGTNHVLPTYGYSKVYSSLNLLDFYRTYTVQTISKKGLEILSKAIIPLAQAEGLDAHSKAVSIRLESINNE